MPFLYDSFIHNSTPVYPGALSSLIELNGCELRREGANHTVYVNRKERKSSAVPRHREGNDFLARKICDALRIERP